MIRYPLIFAFEELIVGVGYLATIKVSGRAVAEVDDDGTWIFGLNPGALAESGRDVRDAMCNFRNRFKAVLVDVANEAGSFTDFQREVVRFFHESDDETAREWAEARERLRQSNEGVDGLSRENNIPDPRIEVRERRTEPRANPTGLNQEPAMLAA